MSHTRLSEWITAVILFLSACILMSLMDDGYEERKRAGEEVKEAIKTAKAEDAERKRIYDRLSAEGAYMTGMVAAK